jgi:MerR family transcriptional regulator, copper efflux regulator
MEGGMGSERYRVGELAQLCGVNPRTIDFYTNAGLLPPVERSAGGHRFYDAEAIRRIRLIKALRAQGLHLDAIRDRLAAVGGTGDGLARIEQLQVALHRLEGEVAELTPQLSAVDAKDRRVVQSALMAAASFALGLSQELMELLGQIGTGLF